MYKTRLIVLSFSFQCCCVSTSSQEIVRFKIYIKQPHSSFILITHSDAAVARFSDDRCEADGVCPSDPLTFTCVINGALNLRVQLPNGHDETVSLGNGPEDVDLPDGFTAVTLAITEIDSSTRDFLLTLSIAEASLLAGGEIRCDDTIPGNGNAVMAGCPILGKRYFQTCAITYIIWTQGHMV